jgi:hypothetical protein
MSELAAPLELLPFLFSVVYGRWQPSVTPVWKNAGPSSSSAATTTTYGPSGSYAAQIENEMHAHVASIGRRNHRSASAQTP